jgi:hypothetical protein
VYRPQTTALRELRDLMKFWLLIFFMILISSCLMFAMGFSAGKNEVTSSNTSVCSQKG